MKALIILLLIFGGLLTFLSSHIASFLLKDKREPSESDIGFVKLSGFALVLIAVIITFFN